MITRGFKVTTYILTVALFYNWKFLLNSARSHWLLRGHMTSNNETVSRQNPWAREQCKKIKTSEGNNFQLYNTSLKDWCLGNLFPRWPVIKCLLLLWSLLIETQNLNWQPRWLPPRKRDSPKFRARDVGLVFSLSVGNGKSWRLKYAFLRHMRFNKASVHLCPINWEKYIKWSG